MVPVLRFSGGRSGPPLWYACAILTAYILLQEDVKIGLVILVLLPLFVSAVVNARFRNTYRSRKATTKGKKGASNEFKETTNGEAKIS